MNFSQRLQKLRNESELTQKELAEKLNIRQQAISQYEKGASTPKMDILLRLAEILNVPVGYLLNGTNDPTSTDLPDDVLKLLEIYDSLPVDKKNISIELLRVLKDTSEKEV